MVEGCIASRATSRRVFLDTYGEYISTNENESVLDASTSMPNAPIVPNRVGIILLFMQQALLLNETR
jgi:extradiol dioxygenase family protein